MPNWVQNAVELHGAEDDIRSAADLMTGTDGNIDFDKIIPMPEELRNATDRRARRGPASAGAQNGTPSRRTSP